MILTATALAGIQGTAFAQTATAPTDAPTQTAPGSDQSDTGDVVVTGIRSSLRNAINVKREANAVVDVITAEDVGKFPTATSRNRCRTSRASASTAASARARRSRSWAPTRR
ncbi:hypothetical protein P0F65_03990 [Sphingomonas sp. I4]